LESISTDSNQTQEVSFSQTHAAYELNTFLILLSLLIGITCWIEKYAPLQYGTCRRAKSYIGLIMAYDENYQNTKTYLKVELFAWLESVEMLF
jgi:hypothetical protein